MKINPSRKFILNCMDFISHVWDHLRYRHLTDQLYEFTFLILVLASTSYLNLSINQKFQSPGGNLPKLSIKDSVSHAYSSSQFWPGLGHFFTLLLQRRHWIGSKILFPSFLVAVKCSRVEICYLESLAECIFKVGTPCPPAVVAWTPRTLPHGCQRTRARYLWMLWPVGASWSFTLVPPLMGTDWGRFLGIVIDTWIDWSPVACIHFSQLLCNMTQPGHGHVIVLQWCGLFLPH